MNSTQPIIESNQQNDQLYNILYAAARGDIPALQTIKNNNYNVHGF
jgi:hypothetical protein